MRVYKNSWFDKFARKAGIADHALSEAVARAERGQIDADLGGGLLKQRVARVGEGRSGGYRTVMMFRSGDRAVFVFGFAKKDRANLDAAERAAFKQAAQIVLGLSQDQMDVEVNASRLMEIAYDDPDL